MEDIQPKVRALEAGQVSHGGGRSREVPSESGCCVLVQSGKTSWGQWAPCLPASGDHQG